DVTPLATTSYRDALEAYVNNGGRLIIEGGHIAKYVPADSFMSTVLHATTDFVYSDVGDMTFKTSHPVATTPNTLPATIGFTATNPGDTSGDADAVRCLSDAVGVYGWSDVRWGGSSVTPSVIEACNSIIAYDDDADVSNGGQIVFFAIDIDDIDSTDTQNQTINNSVTWIIATPSENDVGVESIDTPVNGENYSSGTRDVNATVKNYGTNSQSNFNVSCEIIEVLQKGSTTPLLSENFDEGGALPSGWNNATYTWRDWRSTNDGARYGSIVDGTDYGFVCDSDRAGSGAVDSWLKTPVIDCSGYDIVQLNFTHRYRWYYEVNPEGIYVYVATDGSVDSADNVGYHSVGSDISLETKTIDISTYAAGQSNVQIGFRYIADFDYWWVIDDVIVNGIIPQIENTVYINNQTVTAVLAQNDTVQVNWSYNFANATDYKIVVKTLLPGDTKWFNDEKSITITIISSAFVFSLQEGWNFITLPLNTTYERAEDLANAVPNCTHISEWNISTSSFVSHQKGTDVNNFTIHDGVGYMVYVEGDTIFEVNGIEISPVTMNLQQGWNSIGWFNETSTDAESLAQNITNCTAIAYWNNTLGRF
ncbi:MAG: choice-of-anchor J domain-containing protein, partial [Thermoplasmatales archaeon]|nr:choice-of-anchor J domain-containing protein [Thermoplasmatales archaeon]